MRKLLIIGLILAGCSNQPQHCDWEECPANQEYKEYTDMWFIRQIHMNNPELSYEKCEYIFFYDCKDTTINN